jgi:FtsH-binding integral membrane protein
MNSRMWSLVSIVVLLVGIFGVIFIPEQDPVHYIFAAAAFFAITGFMIGHTFTGTTAGADIHDILRILLYAQILFMIVTVIGVLQDAAIFTIEALFLANFAVFYLYLHYHTFCSS